MTSLGIIGYGSFGKLVAILAARFLPQVSVRVYSTQCEPDGVAFFPMRDAAACDAVIFAVPIHAFESALHHALPYIRPEAVIIDVATVKTYTVDILRRIAVGKRWIATHPMFGPESYEKKGGDVSGFRIVVAEHTLAHEEYDAVVNSVRAWGFAVVETTSELHDRHLAETLFLTHFIGQIVARAGFSRTEIDTVSFGFLMDAMETVRHDTKLFQDVFRFNPFCKEVLDRFEVSEGEVRRLLEKV